MGRRRYWGKQDKVEFTCCPKAVHKSHRIWFCLVFRQSTVVLVCIVYFIVTPIIYALLRAASISTMLCCWSGDRRRYIDDSPYNDNGADEENPKVDDPSIVDMYVDDTTTGHESHYDEQEGEGGNAVTY